MIFSSFFPACSTSFSNCAKCYDDDASDSIDQYECLKCGDGYYMVDYEYECASKFKCHSVETDFQFPTIRESLAVWHKSELTTII